MKTSNSRQVVIVQSDVISSGWENILSDSAVWTWLYFGRDSQRYYTIKKVLSERGQMLNSGEMINRIADGSRMSKDMGGERIKMPYDNPRHRLRHKLRKAVRVLSTLLIRLMRGQWVRYTIFTGTNTMSEVRLALVALLGRVLLTGGPDIDEYEWRFAEAVGTRYAFSFAAGRMALYVLLEVLGVGPGELSPSGDHQERRSLEWNTNTFVRFF